MLLTTACNRIYLFPLSMQEYTHFKEHLRLAIPVGRRVNFISLRWMSRKAARVTSKTIVRLYFTFRRKRDLCHVIRIIQYSFLIKKKKIIPIRTFSIYHPFHYIYTIFSFVILYIFFSFIRPILSLPACHEFERLISSLAGCRKLMRASVSSESQLTNSARARATDR